MKKIIYFVFSLFFLIAIVFYFNAQNSYVTAQEAKNYVPESVLVKFKTGTSQKNIEVEIKKNNASILGKITALETFILKVPQNKRKK